LRVIIETDASRVARRGAEFIGQLVKSKPNAVLGLATGGTVVSCYQELIRIHQTEGLDFSSVRTFNLDEYVGLGPDHPQSYARFMREQLFQGVNFRRENCLVPDGLANDFASYCEWYEDRIRRAGGIDLQLLGIGRDGHIAFNEPGSSLGSRTRLKTLTPETIADNARFFGSPSEVPPQALTMGVGTILESRRCLLIAVGTSKADAIALTVEGPITAQVTASALQLHRDVTILLDEAAASQLRRREYYRQVEIAHQRLTTHQSSATEQGERS
jgi:glucosamine-6-phosphate deaminase